jgi:hypothetical protein
MTTIYKINDNLSKEYNGSGYALAAILDGQVVSIRYLADVAPIIADHLDGPNARFFVRQWIQSADSGQIVRELQALGDVSIGMLSGWEFTEL